MIQSKPLIIIIHLAGWLLFFSLMMSFLSASPGGGNPFRQLLSLHYLVFYVVYAFLFYFNTDFLIPEFYLKKKYLFYFAIILVLFIMVYFLRPFDHLLSLNREPPKRPISP